MNSKYISPDFSWLIRRHVLEMIHMSHGSHIASNFSEVEILVTLYNDVMNINPTNPNDVDRDYFILSKGHASAALYALLAELGYFPIKDLLTFDQNGSLLSGHVSYHVPGIEHSTGSLGHGLSYAVGLALGLKLDNKKNKVYVLIGDGECDEGQVYEALLFASQHKLDNLYVLVDLNKMSALGNTKDILNLEPIVDKFVSFNFDVKRVDGHNCEEIKAAIEEVNKSNKPKAIICDTIKGKGISFMENDILWHYRYPHDEEGEYLKALAELKGKQPINVKDPYKI